MIVWKLYSCIVIINRLGSKTNGKKTSFVVNFSRVKRKIISLGDTVQLA